MTVQHMSFPLRFRAGLPVMVDQDSPEQIAECVRVVLSYPLGSCVDLPAFGRPDPTFLQNGIDPAELQAVVDLWEPRASGSVTRDY